MDKESKDEKSLGGNLWKILPVDEKCAEYISQRYNLPYIISKIIAVRGIATEDIEKFLSPKLQNLMPDPHCLKDMKKAASRLAKAIIDKETIGIIGDYDVDGATSTSVMRLFLEQNGIQPLVHIPEREEGYGPSCQAFDEFKEKGCRFVITVDCGTTAFEVFDYAQSQGFEVIVIDHHEAEVKLPQVYALVNPKRLDEENDYEYLKYLAAVGVVFLTIVAVNRELREQGYYKDKAEPNLMNLLDLVSLGTVCDVVPLLGLNRAYVRQGLKVMSKRQNIGLKALIDKSGIQEAPGAFHLGYVLGPRINACGRVGEASLGNKLLCAKTSQEAEILAEKLNDFNNQRKEIEAYVLLKAIEILESTPQEYPIAFVSGKDWHQGVIGIVAGKLKERYNVPSFVMSIEADEVKGSARSIPGIDLGALVMSAKEKGILSKGGGHIMAAGFSLNEDKIEEFKRFAGEYVKEHLGDETITPVIEIDSQVDIAGINEDLAEKLELLEPYGSGNSEPKLLIPSVRISKASIVGNGHIRCYLGSLKGGSIKAMAFRAGDTELGKAMLSANGESYDVVGVLRRDTWQGRNSIQFIIEDAKRHK